MLVLKIAGDVLESRPPQHIEVRIEAAREDVVGVFLDADWFQHTTHALVDALDQLRVAEIVDGDGGDREVERAANGCRPALIRQISESE